LWLRCSRYWLGRLHLSYLWITKAKRDKRRVGRVLSPAALHPMKNYIFLLILTALLSLSTGCSLFRWGWVDENSYAVEDESEPSNDSILPDDIGPLGGHFDNDGKWIPDDPDIELTYKIPDISAGFIFDINSLSASPSIQVELFEFDTRIPYVRRIKFDLGVAYQRGFIYAGKLWTSVFEISTGGFIGWNWEDEQLSYGFAFTIIKF